MACTNEASAAYAEMQRKVAELQDAIIAFGYVFETNAVGLVEWMEHMDEVMCDIEGELYCDDDGDE